MFVEIWGPINYHVLALIPVLLSYYIRYKMWNEIHS